MITIYLSENQIKAINYCDAMINIWCGAVRSGKTYSSLWAFVKWAQKAMPGDFVIIGKTLDTLKRTVISQLTNFEKFPGINIRVKEREILLEGRRVFLIGCNDERAEGNIRGPTFVGGYVDEATLIPKSCWRMLISRFSEGEKKTKSRLFATTNPDSPFHFLKEDIEDNKDDPEMMKVFNFKMEDNPCLSIDYINRMKRFYKGMWYKRYIEGEWCLAEGTVFAGFSESLHTIDEAPTFAKYYLVGVDHGIRNAFAAILIGFNDDSPGAKIWVEKEFYYDSRRTNVQKSDFELADNFQAFIEGYPIKCIYIDSSASSFKQELRRRRLEIPVQDANKDVSNGIRELATRLYSGDLRILKNCKNIIKEFYSYLWDEKKVKNGKDEPMKCNDHCLDALRYAVYTKWGDKRDLKEMTEEERKIASWEKMQQRYSPWNPKNMSGSYSTIRRR